MCFVGGLGRVRFGAIGVFRAMTKKFVAEWEDSLDTVITFINGVIKYVR